MSKKHGLPVPLERLFDSRPCVQPCREESTDVFHLSEPNFRLFLPLNRIKDFHYIEHLLFPLFVPICQCQSQLAPSVPLFDSEQSEAREEVTKNFSKVVSVCNFVKSHLSLPLNEELVPVVEILVEERQPSRR